MPDSEHAARGGEIPLAQRGSPHARGAELTLGGMGGDLLDPRRTRQRTRQRTRSASVSFRATWVVLCALTWAGADPVRADQPDPETSAQTWAAALQDPGRAVRERAVSEIRAAAVTDPARALALFPQLDARGQALLLRAVASAGTKRAATLALQIGVTCDDSAFAALVRGLVDGGARSIAVAPPETMPASRKQALHALALRWKVEREMARLKSLSGLTGHYTNQYKALTGLGQEILPIFFAMVKDKAFPLPGESAAGRYQSIHPWMLRYEKSELRTLAAYAFAELTDRTNVYAIAQLEELFRDYFRLPPDEKNRFERDGIASAIAYSLFDLGHPRPVLRYIDRLRVIANRTWVTQDVLNAKWNLGYAYIRIGKTEEGAKWYEQLIRITNANGRAVAAYNLACMWSKEGEGQPSRRRNFEQRSIAWLERAVHEFGYADWIWMEEDKDLDGIRHLARYKRLLQHLKKQYPDTKRRRVSKKLEEFLGGKDDDGEEKGDDGK